MNSIDESKNKILSGIEAKRRSVRRKWMEINSLANAHMLILLPYHAMLTHVGQLIEERNSSLVQSKSSKLPNLDERTPTPCCASCSSIDAYVEYDDEYMEFPRPTAS